MVIETARFGRTGHDSTRVVFGGAALYAASQAEADATFEVLMSFGINHIDVAAGYGDAELRVRPWLRRAPGAVLPGHQDGPAGPGRGPGRARAVIGTHGGGPRRPLAAAQPGRPHRLGRRPQPGRCAGGRACC